MYSGRSDRKSLCLFSAAALVGLLVLGPAVALAEGGTGNVYVMTNQSAGNAILVFHRDAAGILTSAATFATGGNGAGTGADPLGSQGAVVLSDDERFLFAVNSGSNSISAFTVSGDQLDLRSTVSSGGIMPVSVTARHGLVYVVNAGGTPNISGFALDANSNQLVPLAGSSRNLPGGAGAGPAQISFSPDGGVLVVTEKNTNRIDSFTLDDRLPARVASFPSLSTTPFGFGFGRDDAAIVSDAGSGSGTAAVSSYEVEEDGGVTIISPPAGDTQSAACWIAVLRNGRFAYTTNASSGTISSYAVSEDGKLALKQVMAASTGDGSTPTDMALNRNSRFLYARDGGNGTVAGFRVGPDGTLTPLGTVSGIPSGAQGIAAR